MKFILAAILFMTAPIASASYLESCLFTAEVANVVYAPQLNGSVQEYQPLVELLITDWFSHVRTLNVSFQSLWWFCGQFNTILQN